MIKVANREDRQHWVTCLNAAAQLKITDLYDYDPKVEFGRGRYAAVYPARRRGRDRQTYEDKLSLEGLDPKAIVKQCDCAIKIIDKNEFWKRVVKGKERADTLVREVTTQATLTAKCGGQISTFVRLRGFFETANEVVLELELLEGFDLFKYVSSKGVLDETEAACITRDILTSLENMHRVGLSHRDIKPANILMCDLEKHGAHVKVGDFGMATFIGVDGLVRGRCGTPGYVAPEIFNAMKRGGYGVNADVFSTGVTLYVMLCGYEPFYGETDDELVAANREACFEFPEGDWSSGK
jgi:calcium/calmodulin-dependent protein kinase I